MKTQLVILAIAVIGSIKAAPQNEAAIEGQGEEIAVGVAERKGADESISDYQNDNNYRYYQYYGSKGTNMMYMSPYYISRTAYNRMASDLAQCQKERDTLMVVQSTQQQEAGAVVEEEDESDEESEEVEVASMCAMKADSGPCRSYIQRYYYNEDTQRCELFVYGGCLGNTNNFRTKYECENSCMNQCSRPLNVGYCSARLPRYYYNSATGRCELFSYGGCGGNGNNFMTMQECQASCDDTCVLPKEKGSCLSALARWYHNSETNKCEVFIFSGCGGNANNFFALACKLLVQYDSKASNMKLLVVKVFHYRRIMDRAEQTKLSSKEKIINGFNKIHNGIVDVFAKESAKVLPNALSVGIKVRAEQGCSLDDTNSTVDTFYFLLSRLELSFKRNSNLLLQLGTLNSHEIISFLLALCQMSFQNFEVLDQERFDIGLCSSPLNWEYTLDRLLMNSLFILLLSRFEEYYFSRAESAIAVIGTTKSAPQNEAVAAGQEKMPVGVAERKGADDSSADYQNDHHTVYYASKGMSNAYMAPYYVSWTAYNKMATDLAQCQRERDALMVAQSSELQQEAGEPVEEDESKEEKEEEEVPPMCAMKADSGPCRSYVQRYYYNEDTQNCEKFTYGGCNGNTNNFRTKYECENSCMNRCSKPVNVGYCLARLPRYYFNSATARCELFYYGGCGGNTNNFMTMQECQASCDSVCVLPKEQGVCVSAMARWYHNSVTGQCEVFIYSGCGGNANNFMTKEACDAQC
ncbi:papilin-like [Watersipora subatra]|uniref:papilin-like n=1 Tax=Watersipora subatra TaxID=2589382 RepID=UPI00355C6A98